MYVFVYRKLLYTKILKGKSLQSAWVQSHKLSHNIVNFLGDIVLFERNIVMLIVYVSQFGTTKFPCLERQFCLPKLTQVPRINIKELPLSSESIYYCLVPLPKAKICTIIKENLANLIDNNNILSARSYRNMAIMLTRLQINEYSAHSAIMTFKNRRKYPLLSRFGTDGTS